MEDSFIYQLINQLIDAIPPWLLNLVLGIVYALLITLIIWLLNDANSDFRYLSI